MAARHRKSSATTEVKRMQPETIIFWGAGATASLGLRTTTDQARFILELTGARSNASQKERIEKALGADCEANWHGPLADLISILGDDDRNYGSIGAISKKQLKAMRDNWRKGASDEELTDRIVYLRLVYDWPALKSLVSICPGIMTGTFKLNDLFNLLDLHIPLGFGVRGQVRSRARNGGLAESEFLDARRLVGAKNALRMLLNASFYIDWQQCLDSKLDELSKYFEFAVALWNRMQLSGAQFTEKYFTEPEFYQCDVGFVSLNYDPIGLWMQFIANKRFNTPSVPFHLFQDFAHLIPARRISRSRTNWPWYPMNEGATQRLNELKEGKKIRLIKYLFPHGCLCWRECPNCRKLSAFHGDEWEREARGLFPPPPLYAFDPDPFTDRIVGEERREREKGAVDARACLHCDTLTYAQHTQTVMQSSFKSPPPSFIEEIQRDLRATTMRAKHIIFMGYSLPADDVDYRALFAASRKQRLDENDPVCCTIVGKDEKHAGWHRVAAKKSKTLRTHPTVQAAIDLFGEENVRFYGGGVPEVFLDGNNVTKEKVDQLLTWSR